MEEIFSFFKENLSLSPPSVCLCFLSYGAWTMTCNQPTDHVFLANPTCTEKGVRIVGLVFSSLLFCLDRRKPQMHDDPKTLAPPYDLPLKIINCCQKTCLCRESRNEASNSQHFPLSAYARRPIINKSILISAYFLVLIDVD